jgi:hypothetical protein
MASIVLFLIVLLARLLRTLIIEAGSTARTQMECQRDVEIARLNASRRSPGDERRLTAMER